MWTGFLFVDIVPISFRVLSLQVLWNEIDDKLTSRYKF